MPFSLSQIPNGEYLASCGYSPEEVEAASMLCQLSRSACSQTQIPPAMARREPDHGSPTTRPPGDYTGGGTLEAARQHTPQQGQGQRRKRKLTCQNDGRANGPAYSASADFDRTRPPTNPSPQFKERGRRDEEKNENKKQKIQRRLKKENKEDEMEKEPEGGKTTKAKGGGTYEKMEKPFRCHCGRSYWRQEHLTRHEECAHKKVRYQCDICHTVLTRFDNLLWHRRQRHRDAGPAPKPEPLFLGPAGGLYRYGPADVQARPGGAHLEGAKTSAR